MSDRAGEAGEAGEAGDPSHTVTTRHVFGAVGEEVDEGAVRKVAEAVTGTGVWLKAFRDLSVVGAWLGEQWWVDPEPGYLMAVPLTAAGEEPSLPDGYWLRTWSRGGVVHAMVTAADGSWAASGRIAPTGATAVADLIETSSAHRRRGLGSVVMRTLQRAAAAQGAETGLLVGTPAGRALYETLGWAVVAPLASATFVGPAGAEADTG
ncbi:hypothetical protein GCM10027074_25990 [Streptomyces deserti]